MGRRSRVNVIYLLIIVTIGLTGCWDRREMNDLAIAVGMGLDKNGNLIQVTSQIVNPSEVTTRRGGGGYTSPVTILSAAQPTTIEALAKLSTISPRKIYSSHLRVLVIGEELARQGIEKILDGVSRNHEFRSDFYLIIARKTSAKKVLEILTPIEKIPSNKMFSMLEMSEKTWAPTVKMQLDNFISDLSNPTKDTVLTGVMIFGDQEEGQQRSNVTKSEPYANLQYMGLALFKQDKLVDWLNEEESKGYNYIMGNVKKTIGHISCPQGGTLAVEVSRTKSKIKGKVVNGEPHISIKLFVEQNIGEVQCKIDLTQSETIAQLEKISREKLTEIMKSSISKAQKNKTDIFGFGESIEDSDPKAWMEMKKDWDQHFAKLNVTVEVDVQTRRLGTISNSFLERKD
jgi:spore germination protein KC